MKTYLYTTGTIALALAMGISPTLAYADDGESSGGSSVSVSATVEVRTQNGEDAQRPTLTQLRALVASTSAAITPEMRQRAEDALQKLQEMEKERAATNSDNRASSTEVRTQVEQMKQDREQVREDVKQQVEQVRELFKSELQLLRESSTTPAQTVAQLRKMIEERKTTIENIVASSTSVEQKVFEHASRVSVAVHALIASKDLLGGIGQQVSDIARQVDDSVGTTTTAEAKIESRGFFTKLLFGGDSQAAGTIAEQVSKNKEHIAQIAALLNQSTTSAEVRAELEIQLDAMNQEQVRLQALAKSQNSLWGLFSWRF